MHELWLKILQTGGAKIYGVVTGILTLAITARWLGPEGRGEVAAIVTWVTTFSTFAYLSLGQVAIHRASQIKGTAWLRESLSSLVFFAIFLTLVSWLAAFSLYIATDGVVFGDITPAWLALGFLLLPFMIWEQYGSSLLMALERLDIYNRYQIIGRTFSVFTVVFLIVMLGFGVVGSLLGNLVGQLVVAIGGVGFLVKQAGGIRRPKLEELTSFVRGGLKLHLNAIGVFFFTSADILMLNYYRGAEETGFYQLGVQMMGIMMIMPYAASMVIYGKVTNSGPDGAWDDNKKILAQMLGLMIIGALLAGITAPWWVVWVAGNAFEATVDVFRWQLIAVVGMTFSTVMSPQWIGRGYFWQASLLTIVIGLGNLAANAVLIPEYGMYGAIWASLGVYAFSVIGNGLMVIWCELASRKAKVKLVKE